MHELAITCNIIGLVKAAARGRRVLRVSVEIGRLSGVLPDAVAFCFPEAARGTLAETARLEIREIDGRARCEACGSEFPTADMLATCRCGSERCKLVAGEELNLRSIELEEAE